MNRAAASILGRSEFKKLMGKRGGNLLFLMGVFSFSLFAIGATKGVLNFLQERMEDPFVQLVGIEIPREISISTCNEWVFGADCPSLDDGCNPASLARCTGWKEEFGIQDFVSIYQTARLFSATGDTNAVDVDTESRCNQSIYKSQNEPKTQIDFVVAARRSGTCENSFAPGTKQGIGLSCPQVLPLTRPSPPKPATAPNALRRA